MKKKYRRFPCKCFAVKRHAQPVIFPDQRRVQQRERSLSHSTVANSDVLNGSERSPLEQKWRPIGN